MFAWNRWFSKSATVALLVLLPVVLAFGQMGGGMGGGMMGGNPQGGMPGGIGPHQPGVLPLGGTMSGGMMAGAGVGMVNALTLGPDGTPYLVRRAVSATAGQLNQPLQIKNELVALDTRNGTAKWKLEITANHISEPAAGKDGRLFLTLSDRPMFRWFDAAGTLPKARLIVVSTTPTSAAVARTIEIESDLVSAPQVAPDETGNYVVYVIGAETGGFRGLGDRDSIPAGERDLYAFFPDGRLKFKVKID